MAVDPDAPQVERFISIGDEARLLRYNSRVPLVVYVPAGVEVRHRLWRAEPTGYFVEKLALPSGQTAVVAEGDFEARSIGSYSVRIYSRQSAQPDDDTTSSRRASFAPATVRLRRSFSPSCAMAIRPVWSSRSELPAPVATCRRTHSPLERPPSSCARLSPAYLQMRIPLSP